MRPRVLVVDDNPELAENIGEILADEGFEVRVSSDPFAALRIAETEPIDVALLDVRMPGMDGVTLHSELARRAPRAKFVLMTAYAADERLDAARRAGIRCVLPKPIPIEQLLEALRAPTGETSAVLVVDDDPAVRESIAELLRDAGREVDVAGTLEESRELLASRRYASVVLDIRLPDGSGLAFAEETAAREVSVVLITGFDLDGGSGRLPASAGDRVVAVLRKPFDPRHLLDVVGAGEDRA